MLSQQKLAPPKGLDKLLEKHADLIDALEQGKEAVQKEYAENGGMQLQLFWQYPASKGNLVELAKMLDNAGKLEEYVDVLPGFSTYRRLIMRMPPGQQFRTEPGRAQLREHQRTIGADMVLQIMFLDEEWSDEAELRGARRAVHEQGFSQIIPDFGTDQEFT